LLSNYPGASKWNPIEHRLFSEISKNWAGKPPDSYETVVNYISTTKTSKGLTVEVELTKNTYQKGERVFDRELESIPIDRYEKLPDWNYTLKASKCEVIFA